MSDLGHDVDGLRARLTEDGTPHCFYCGLVLYSREGLEYDHFPLPAELGGDRTVPACLACHDLKDRVPLINWPIEAFGKAMGELNAAGPYARIALAKCLQFAMREECKQVAS